MISKDLPEPEAQDHILYRAFDAKLRLLYVGITLDFGRRMEEHRRRADWFESAAHITLERFESRAELCAAEMRVIATERPKFNIQGLL
jgi:predicted GIY-YIG superfamily endonuclease